MSFRKTIRLIKKRRDSAKVVFIALTCLLSIESFLWVLEINHLIDEPYLWGNRNDFAIKINDCNALFSRPENKDKTRVVIIGDSRAHRAFDPFTFDKLFKNKTISYNLGIVGTAVKFQSLIIQNVLIQRINPDIIIWAVSSPGDFLDIDKVTNQEENNMDSIMARYYSGDSSGLSFEESLDLWLLRISHIYRYRYFLVPEILYQNTQLGKELNTIDERGFVINYDVFEGYPGETGSIIDVLYNGTYNDEYGSLFSETVSYLEKTAPNFLIISNPTRFTKFIYPKVDKLFEKINSKNFLNLNGAVEFANNSLHRDSTHLNYYGAQVYTEFVAGKIKDLI